MTILKFNEINKATKQSGIYMIKNILNNNKYIGSTNNFKRRFNKHRSELRKNIHHSIHLQRAYNKYGEDKFIFVILEICEPVHDTLLMLEQKYLDLQPEYNSNKNSSRKYSKIPVIKQNKLKRKVNQYDLNGVFLKTFDSISDAARSFNSDKYTSIRTTITACCNGQKFQAIGYLWKYHDDNRDIFDVIKQKKNCGKAVEQLDKEGKYIRTFDNMAQAAICCGSIANRSAINRVCLGQKKTAFGYKWRYKR